MVATAIDKTSAIYSKLVEIISSGSFSPGERLPNERDLANQFSIGRGVVRNALSRMEAEGLVFRRVGSGTYIADDVAVRMEMRDAKVKLSDDSPRSFYEMIEARLSFEPSVAAMAATRVVAADKKKIEAALARFDTELDWLAFKEAIYTFQRCVYEIAGNNFLLSMFDSIHKSRRQVNYDGRYLQVAVAKLIRDQTKRDLRLICEAVCSGVEEHAAAQMKSYLLRILANHQ